jgi:hypothetical protein
VEQAGTELGWWMEMMTLDALARLLLSIEEGRKGVGGVKPVVREWLGRRGRRHTAFTW